MDIVKDYNELRGWFTYKSFYDDGSDSEEQFTFKDFYEFRYYSDKIFLSRLKIDNECKDITLTEVHIQSNDNKFHVHINEDVFQGCCHDEIDNDLIDRNYIKQMDNMKRTVKRASDILDSIK